jgi:hypothetical protein
MISLEKPALNAEEMEAILGEPVAIAKGRNALLPEINALLVADAFNSDFMGKDVDVAAMRGTLMNSMGAVRDGDLDSMEAMLVGQATALQTIFTSLAIRASKQNSLPQYQAYLALALKAQAQSRATISALVDLKYPKQAMFVKQANIAHGPQQVNNGVGVNKIPAGESKTLQNELLVEANHERTKVDAGTTPAATRSHTAMETVAPVNRAKKPRRQGHGSP